jgi:plasmid stability protein
MGELRVRNLDEQVVLEFRERARRHGRSLEAELRSFLSEEAFRPHRELADESERLCESIRARVGVLPDSTPYVREERDRLG